MRQGTGFTVLLVAACALSACGAADDAPAVVEIDVAPPAPMPEFNPVVSTAVLMRGTVSMAAEDYWQSVSIVIDRDGEHENFPETEAEWERVWAAGITLAETGNLLRIPPRNIDDPEWARLTQAMIDTGMDAARAADAQDHLAVLDEGERIYNVCTECHEIFYPSLDL